MLRASENFGRAADAARALGVDNFIAVHCKLLQGDMLCVYATNAPDAAADPRKVDGGTLLGVLY